MMLNYIHWSTDPEIINIFGLSLRYYGILFVGGLILCISLLGCIKMRDRLKNGFFFGLGSVLFFTARFIIEFAKEDQVGFEGGMKFNMGQLLSLPFIAAGIGFVIYGLRKTKAEQLRGSS